jgi:hypothetical protein
MVGSWAVTRVASGGGEEADAVGAGGFEGLDVSLSVVERADRAEFGPPVRRHGREALEAPRPVASDQIVEERHGVRPAVGASSRPASQGAMCS